MLLVSVATYDTLIISDNLIEYSFSVSCAVAFPQEDAQTEVQRRQETGPSWSPVRGSFEISQIHPNP